MTLDDALAACPVIAILRGVRPDEVVAHAQALFDVGICAVEVPLNSPDPLSSVAALAGALGGSCLCGAGTVLTVAEVEAVEAAGGRLIVSPNIDADVVSRAVALGLASLPGIATASEAFRALDAGARHLKLFPAATYGPGHTRQLRAVLPADVTLLAVGGVGPADMAAWWNSGVRGFGLGSELYGPGQTPTDTATKAARVMEAVRALA